jgi:hypothetical protein
MRSGTSRILSALAFAGVLFGLGLMVASANGVSLVGARPVDVVGRVTYKGNPVTNAVIVFVPAEGKDQGEWLVAGLGPDGSFALMKYKGRSLEPGLCRIFILSLEPTHRPEGGPLKTGGADAGGQASSGAGAPPRAERFPARFANPGTSDLSVTLKHGRFRIEVDLTD